MGIALSDEEIWADLERAHTGILTTLRRDGWPISLPVWFVALDRRIYVSTPAGAKKVARIRNDARATFLVESGQRWIDLRAAMLPVLASVVDNDAERSRASAALAAKYAAHRPPSGSLPRASTRHYARSVVIRLEQAGPALSWDNRKLRLEPSSGSPPRT